MCDTKLEKEGYIKTLPIPNRLVVFLKNNSSVFSQSKLLFAQYDESDPTAHCLRIILEAGEKRFFIAGYGKMQTYSYIQHMIHMEEFCQELVKAVGSIFKSKEFSNMKLDS
jgi:hypothetical protein